MEKEQDTPIIEAIIQSCQMTAVKRASAAFPQFQVDEALPEAMIELLARLEQSSGQDPDIPR
jgi:hypothetical protein